MKCIRSVLVLALTLLAGAAGASEVVFFPASQCHPADPDEALAYSDVGEAYPAVSGFFANVQCPIPRTYGSSHVSAQVYVVNDAAYTFTCVLSRHRMFGTSGSVVGSTSAQGNATIPLGGLSLQARDVLNLNCAIPHSSEMQGFHVVFD